MAMTRFGTVLIGLALCAACTSKPSEEACEKAVTNIRKLTGQSQTDVGADKRAAVRSCRAQSSRETVECMAEARTAEELFACGGKMAEEIKKVMEAEKKGAAEGGAPPDDSKEPGKGP